MIMYSNEDGRALEGVKVQGCFKQFDVVDTVLVVDSVKE